MARCILYFSVLITILWSVQCANILSVVTMPAHSHFSLIFRLSKELADRGHQVTAINPYPQKTAIKNYTDVSTADIVPILENGIKKDLFDLGKLTVVNQLITMSNIGGMITENTFQNKDVQEILNSGKKFDVMIMEHFLNDALVGLADHFKIPVVLISSVPSNSLSNYVLANPEPVSYIPNYFSTLTGRMSFLERITNFCYNIVNDLIREFYYLPIQRKLFKQYLKSEFELDDLIHNVSFLLTNSHVSVTDAIPHLPNIIEIGGFHINPPKKLPDDLQKFLDESKEGVILFSMGSNLKSKDLKPELRDGILKAFSKIKQKVLWKFETNLPNAPKNVKVMEWVPQQDVLAHPNVKAFITHGGLLSTIEAVHFGVPIIGIPVFADQRTNIGTAVEAGYAVRIPFQELSEEKLSRALDEIINNPKYTENVKLRSEIMNDQPMKPIDRAIYWIEFAIKHKGAPFFKSIALELPWYSRASLDVIIVLTLITIALFVIFYIIIKKILGLSKPKAKATKSKKNK